MIRSVRIHYFVLVTALLCYVFERILEKLFKIIFTSLLAKGFIRVITDCSLEVVITYVPGQRKLYFLFFFLIPLRSLILKTFDW